MEDGDALLKCFTPLFNSMRVFGLYFTRVSCRIHDASRSSTVTSQSETTKKWNGGRIYAVLLVVVMWLNAARLLTAFDISDKFGFVLFLKLASVSSGFCGAVFTTSRFVACNTGDFDRIFREARLSNSDVARYRRLAVIHTIVCWVISVTEIAVFLVPMFMMETEESLSLAMTPFDRHFPASRQLLIMAKVMAAVMFVFATFTWLVTHSVNYICHSKVLHCID